MTHRILFAACAALALVALSSTAAVALPIRPPSRAASIW